MGAHPIDAHKCSVSEEVCSIDIESLLKKGVKIKLVLFLILIILPDQGNIG